MPFRKHDAPQLLVPRSPENGEHATGLHVISIRNNAQHLLTWRVERIINVPRTYGRLQWTAGWPSGYKPEPIVSCHFRMRVLDDSAIYKFEQFINGTCAINLLHSSKRINLEQSFAQPCAAICQHTQQQTQPYTIMIHSHTQSFTVMPSHIIIHTSTACSHAHP